jgi:hypothetical protein
MTTLSLNHNNDDLIELNKDSFSKSPFNFNIPTKQNRVNPNNFKHDDLLFNKAKVSSDVLSMSSRSSSVSSSSSSSDKRNYLKKMKKHYSSSESSGEVQKRKFRDNQSVSSNDSDGSEESSSASSSAESSRRSGHSGRSGSSSSEGSSRSSSSNASGSDESSAIVKKHSYDPKRRMMDEIQEKREIIYQLDRLESKGYRVPRKFDMNSNIEEMRMEYNRIVREKELDASVRFQQKMLMAFVSGTEYINSRYDPFTIKLDGWSEQVNENITDFDDIFEELHYKYKSTGKKMAPELRLLISLSGSAFMFHLTSRMFKEQPLPNVEEVLKSDPDLMKQFQNAAAKQYIIGNGRPTINNNTSQPQRQQQSNDLGLFNMVSSLFGSLGGSSPMMPSMPSVQQMQQHSMQKPKSVDDIDNIIKSVHNNISIDNMDNGIETLSVSDEELTSIIEDTADIKILRNTKGNGNKRTLNI